MRNLFFNLIFTSTFFLGYLRSETAYISTSPLLSFSHNYPYYNSVGSLFQNLQPSTMAGLEAVATAANVATIIDFIGPMVRTTLDTLKKLRPTSPDLSDDLLILEGAMSSIPDLMQVVESRYAHSSGVSHFVPQLRKLAYTAEDLVDELSYNELHQQVLQQASPSIVVGEKRKRTFEVSSFLPKGLASTSKEQPSITVVTPERIQNLTEELKRVIHDLKEAIDVANKLLPSVSPTTAKIAKHRETTSTIDLKKVRGREEEKQQMMEFLTPDPLIHDQKVFFFAITGIGGLGKTTLAQYVFNNLKDSFDLKVWICVSDDFDRKRLLQEIIEEIRRASCKIKSINTLEETIKGEVKGKTLLLVLDDVWSTEWMNLLSPLQFSEAKYCKVIVTTREVKNIKQTRDYDSKILSLVGLQGEEFRRLFEEQAFGDKDPTEHPVLRQIGEKIAWKLKGNPLAAKTVGAVLRENLEIQHWNRVVEDELWNLGDKPDDIMPALMLSYLHLPPYLRRCFSYCALFPQDYQFRIERLVWMWIAEGYVVCPNPNERLEDLGFKYFRDLESRSFFAKNDNYQYQELQPMSMGFLNSYKMHDLLQELATFVSLDECFIYRKESRMSDKKALSCHHLSVNDSNLHRLPANLHHIRTLIVFRSNRYSEMSVPFKLLKSLKSVRVLQISDKDSEEKISADPVIWNDLVRLIHLRYLGLIFSCNSENYEPLLKSICSLYHLQTLLLYSDYDKGYSNDMNNLINLRRHRGNYRGNQKYSIARIECIGKLVQLQELYMFEVGKGSLHNIGQLKEMNQLLYWLTISNICQVETADDAKNANMEMKRYLTNLSLQWCKNEQTCCCEDSTIEHHDNVLEYLKPHNNLEELTISHHKGSKPPSWLAAPSLQSIKRITLLHCKKWRLIPHLAQLPHLEYLEMEGMDLVVDLTNHMVAFPSLLELRLFEMSVIFEGISEEGQISCQIFPIIRKIYCDCYKNLDGLIFHFSLHGIPSTLTDFSIHGPCSKELITELGRIRSTNNIFTITIGPGVLFRSTREFFRSM